MNILLTDVSFASALEKLVRSKYRDKLPKVITLTTWTLSHDVVKYLNKLVSKNVLVTVVYAKLLDCSQTDCKFKLVLNRKCHVKLWHIDDVIYLSTANLVSDTIINATIEITDAGVKHRMISFIHKLQSRIDLPVRNILF